MTIQNVEKTIAELESTGNYKVSQRLEFKDIFIDSPVVPEQRGVGVLLDTETTGRDSADDRIIELGLISFEFDKSNGKVHRILESYDELEDPGFPIQPEASKVNGITDEMVAGKKIDDETVKRICTEADILIAHNASFDRPFMEDRFPFCTLLPWACSRSQIDWEFEGIGGQKLDYIAYRFGFFYDAHRADADCRATLEILARPMPVSQSTGLNQLLNAYKEEYVRIWAMDSKFETKSALQKRGYRWGNGQEGKEKAWYTEVPVSAYDDEIAWLKAFVFGNKSFRTVEDRIDAYSRFSLRRTGTKSVPHYK